MSDVDKRSESVAKQGRYDSARNLRDKKLHLTPDTRNCIWFQVRIALRSRCGAF